MPTKTPPVAAPLINRTDIGLQQLAQWTAAKAARKPDARIQVKRNDQGANVLTTGGVAVRKLQVALGRRAPDRTDRENRAVIDNLLDAVTSNSGIQALCNDLNWADRDISMQVRKAVRALQELKTRAATPGVPLRISDLAGPLKVLAEAARAKEAAAVNAVLQRSLDAQATLQAADIRSETRFARMARPAVLDRKRRGPPPGELALDKARSIAAAVQRYFAQGQAQPRRRGAGTSASRATSDLSRARFLRQLGAVVRRSPVAMSTQGALQSHQLGQDHPGMDMSMRIGLGYLRALPGHLATLHREAVAAMLPLSALAEELHREATQAVGPTAEDPPANDPSSPDGVPRHQRLGEACQQAVAAYERALTQLHALAEELLTLKAKDGTLSDLGCDQLQALGCTVLDLVHALTSPGQHSAQLYRVARLGATDPAAARRVMQRLLRIKPPAEAPNAQAAPVDDSLDEGGWDETGEGFDLASAAIGWASNEPARVERPLSEGHFDLPMLDADAHRRLSTSGNQKIEFDDAESSEVLLRREREAGTVVLNGDDAERGDPARARATALALSDATEQLANPVPASPRWVHGTTAHAEQLAQHVLATRNAELKLEHLQQRWLIQQEALLQAQDKEQKWRDENGGRRNRRFQQRVNAARHDFHATERALVAQEEALAAARLAQAQSNAPIARDARVGPQREAHITRPTSSALQQEDDEFAQLLAEIEQREAPATAERAAPTLSVAESAYQQALARLIELTQLQLALERATGYDNQVAIDWNKKTGQRNPALRRQADDSSRMAAFLKRQRQNQSRAVDQAREALEGSAQPAAPASPGSPQATAFESEVTRANEELTTLKAQRVVAQAQLRRTPDAAREAREARQKDVASLDARIRMTQNRLREIQLAQVTALAQTRAMLDPNRAEEAKVIECRTAVERAKADIEQLRAQLEPPKEAQAAAIDVHNGAQKAGNNALVLNLPGKREAIGRAQAAMNAASADVAAVNRLLDQAQAKLQAHEQALQAALSAQAARAPVPPVKAEKTRKVSVANPEFEALEKALEGTDQDWAAWIDSRAPNSPRGLATPPIQGPSADDADPLATGSPRDAIDEPMIPRIAVPGESDEAGVERLIEQHGEMLMLQRAIALLNDWIQRNMDAQETAHLEARLADLQDEWAGLAALSLPDATPAQEAAIAQRALEASRQREAAARRALDTLPASDPTLADARRNADIDHRIAQALLQPLSVGGIAPPRADGP
jgi:hypothetical protein